MSIVVPAVLPSSLADLREKLALFAKLPTVNRVQIDVVDGRFASPASWPYIAPAEWHSVATRGELLPALDRIAYEIDLMCYDAERAVDAWLSLGATRLTVHAESTTDLPRLLAAMRARYGSIVSYGVAINIATGLAALETSLGSIDYVQCMGITQIGRQGQPFDAGVFEKVVIFHGHHPEIPIQIDGGVSLTNAKRLLASGASSLIVGSGILRAKNPATEIEKFDALQTPYGV